MTIDFESKEIKLRMSYRVMMMYERLQQQEDPEFPSGGLTQLIQYFWCFLLATKEGAGTDWDRFVDWVDEHPEKLSEFAEWFPKQTSLIPKKD